MHINTARDTKIPVTNVIYMHVLHQFSSLIQFVWKTKIWPTVNTLTVNAETSPENQIH